MNVGNADLSAGWIGVIFLPEVKLVGKAYRHHG